MGQVVACRPLCGPSCFSVYTTEAVEVEDPRNEQSRMLIKQVPANASSRQSKVVKSRPTSEAGYEGSPASGSNCCLPLACLCGGVLALLLVITLLKVQEDRAADAQSFDCQAVGLKLAMLKQFGKNEGSVKAGLDVWEVGWSPEKRTYCCKKHGVGCKSFNCEGDEPLWTLEERRWCCDMKGRGTDCRTVPPYDCKTDLRPKEDWPGAKRSWCCAKEGLGCGDGEGQPEQTAGGLFGWWPFSQATSQPQSSSEAKEIFNKMAKVIGDAADAQRVAKGGAAGETSAACRTECYLDTVVATCKDWVVDFSRIAFNHEPDSCSKAYGFMRDRCKEKCSECKFEDIPCVNEELTKTPSEFASTETERAERAAIAESASAASAERAGSAESAERVKAPEKPKQAEAKASKVLLSTTTSTTSTPKAASEHEPFDCLENVAEWNTKWSPEKKVWCCRNGATKCPF